MLLDDDIVTDGKAKPGALSGRLGCEERVEHLLLHLGSYFRWLAILLAMASSRVWDGQAVTPPVS
jgi:hypothetical protein